MNEHTPSVRSLRTQYKYIWTNFSRHDTKMLLGDKNPLSDGSHLCSFSTAVKVKISSGLSIGLNPIFSVHVAGVVFFWSWLCLILSQMPPTFI